jgi:hypothetical protein
MERDQGVRRLDFSQAWISLDARSLEPFESCVDVSTPRASLGELERAVGPMALDHLPHLLPELASSTLSVQHGRESPTSINVFTFSFGGLPGLIEPALRK